MNSATNASSGTLLEFIQYGVICLLVAIPLGIGTYAGYYFEPAPGHPADYAIYLNAATIVNTGQQSSLYALNVQRRMLNEITNGEFSEFIVWNHHPLEALLYYPSTFFSYDTGLIIARALNVIGVWMLVAWGLWRVARKEKPALFIFLLCTVAIPFVASSITMGQDSIWMLLLVVAACEFLRSGRSTLAGILLGIATIKLTIALPLLGVLAIAGYWRAVRIASLAAAGALVLSGLVLGFGPIVQFFQLLIRLVGVDGELGLYSSQLWNFRGLLASRMESSHAAFAFTVLAGVAGAFGVARLPPRYVPAVALLAAAFFSPHLYRHDGVFYLGGALLLVTAAYGAKDSRDELTVGNC